MLLWTFTDRAECFVCLFTDCPYIHRQLATLALTEVRGVCVHCINHVPVACATFMPCWITAVGECSCFIPSFSHARLPLLFPEV